MLIVMKSLKYSQIQVYIKPKGQGHICILQGQEHICILQGQGHIYILQGQGLLSQTKGQINYIKFKILVLPI